MSGGVGGNGTHDNPALVFTCGGGSDIRLDICDKRIEFNGVDITRCVQSYSIENGSQVYMRLMFNVKELNSTATD